GAAPGDSLAGLLKARAHFRLRVGAFRDGMHLEERQMRLVGHDGLDSVESGVDRAIALCLGRVMTAIDIERDRRLLRTACASYDCQRQNLDAVARRADPEAHQRFDVLVEDMFLAIREFLEALERVFEGIVTEFIAEILQLLAEGMAARVLAHDERA